MSEVIIKQVEDIEIIQYQPKGVCSKMMQIKIQNNIVKDIEIIGGCAGNLVGIGQLAKGMNINDIISRLSGIPCGKRPTSCPDQLAVALKEYLSAKNSEIKVNV